MPIRSLPENPSLEHLRKQAKRVHRAARACETDARAWVKEFHPRADEAIADFSLADAQLVAARAYGFASWPKLKEHLAVVERFTWDPPGGTGLAGSGSLVDTLVRLACLTYDNWDPSRAEKARRLLAQHPELAEENISAAAAVGDVSAARHPRARFLAREHEERATRLGAATVRELLATQQYRSPSLHPRGRPAAPRRRR